MRRMINMASSLVALGTVATASQAAILVTSVTAPTFVVSATDLANNDQPSFDSISVANYSAANATSTDPNVLADGTAAINSFGQMNDSNQTFEVTITFDTVLNPTGYDITGIQSYAGNPGHGPTKFQKYDVYYATVSNPNFFLLASVDEQPTLTPANNTEDMRVDVAFTGIDLKTGVSALRFDFKPVADSLGSFYEELDVTGVASAVPEPASLSMLALSALGMVRRRKA